MDRTEQAGSTTTDPSHAARRERDTGPVLAPSRIWLGLAGILLGSLLVQLAILPYGNFRYDTGLMATWAARLTSVPFSQFYAGRHSADHLPGDLWLLAGIAFLHTHVWPKAPPDGMTFLAMIKVVPIVANLGISFVLFLIARHLRDGRSGLLAALLFAFNPGPLFVAAFWGQWDAVSTLVVVLAVWLHLRVGPRLSLPVLAIAILIKPPFSALVPILLAVFLRGCWIERRRIWLVCAEVLAGSLLSLVIAAATLRPFAVGLPLLPARWSLFERINVALEAHPDTTLNAFNVWAAVQPVPLANGTFLRDSTETIGGLSAQSLGLLAFGAALAGIVVACWRSPADTMLVAAGLAVTMSSFVLPTRSHERYMFPAIAFSVLIGVLAPRLWWLGASISATFLINLVWAYDRFYPAGVPAFADTPVFVLMVSSCNVLLLGTALLVLFAFPPLKAATSSFDVMAPPDPVPMVRLVVPAPIQVHLRRVRSARVGLGGILALSVFLNFYRLAGEGYGNLYYAATVKSMLTSWHTFLFASFDPAGFVSVDKPPLGFWLQVMSARLFGFTGLSLILPSAIAGVLSIVVIYRLVTPPFGTAAGLIAALTLAVMPINVAAARSNIVDGPLVLVMLLAAWAVSRAAASGRLRPLTLCAVLLGLGFNIKMLQAFLILPACFGIYLLAAPGSLWRRLKHLSVASLVLLAVSMCWSVVVDLTPSDTRPYVGSSIDDSELGLMTGHNGLDRLLPGGPWFRHAGQAVTVKASPSIASGSAGGRGVMRLLNLQLGSQAGWLLPLALVGFVAAVLAFGRLRRPFDPRQQALLLWGSWFGLIAVFFSVANYFHRYYLVVLTPAIAALIGIGVPIMWGEFRRAESPGPRRWLLVAAMIATACLQTHLLWHEGSWAVGLAILVDGVVTGALARLAVTLWKGRPGVPRSMPLLATALVMLLVAPLAWSMLPVWQGSGNPAFPYAGPQPDIASFPPTVTDRQLVTFLEQQEHGERYLVATSNAKIAAPLALLTDDAIMAVGGYSGSDPIVSVPELITAVSQQEVRFFLLPYIQKRHSEGRIFGDSSVERWVVSSCGAVPVEVWQPTKSAGSAPAGQRVSGFSRRGNQLFDCRSALPAVDMDRDVPVVGSRPTGPGPTPLLAMQLPSWRTW